MAIEPKRHILNPVLRLTMDPRAASITGRDKNSSAIKSKRVERQRDRLTKEFRALAEFAENQPQFAGEVVIYASMYDDSLAPTYTPDDLFSKERGAQMLAPYRSGYLIQIEVAELNSFSSIVQRTNRVKDLVDISRLQSIRFFDQDDAVGGLDPNEIWMAAPHLKNGRGFLVRLMPLIGLAPSEALLQVIDGMRGKLMLPAPPIVEQLELEFSRSSAQLLRALQRI